MTQDGQPVAMDLHGNLVYEEDRMTPRMRQYQREAHERGHPEPEFCAVCGDQFTLAEFQDSHYVPNSAELVHARCCDHCDYDGAA